MHPVTAEAISRLRMEDRMREADLARAAASLPSRDRPLRDRLGVWLIEVGEHLRTPEVAPRRL